jgi:hypothetical protein
MHKYAREERKSFRTLRSRTFVSPTGGSLASSSVVNTNVGRIMSACLSGAMSAMNLRNGFDEGLSWAMIVMFCWPFEFDGKVLQCAGEMPKLDIWLGLALALAGCHGCLGVYATSMSLPSTLSDRLLVLGKKSVVVSTRVDWCAQYS